MSNLDYNSIIKTIKKVYKESFDEKTIIWEKKDSNYNLIVTLKEIDGDEKYILWTKLVFPFNEQKKSIRKNVFYYLKDLDCSYNTTTISNIEMLENILNTLKSTSPFGDDLCFLSKWAYSPMSYVNNELSNYGELNYSLINCEYDDKNMLLPCSEIKFDFKLIFSNNIEVNIEVSKNKTLWLCIFDYKDKKSKTNFARIEDLSKEIIQWITSLSDI